MRIIILLFVSNIQSFPTMPARRTANASPVKNALSEELLNHPWCISDRFGLYVQEYDGDDPVTVNSAHDSLSRVGQVRVVTWSGIYPVDGEQENVFKFEVYIRAYSDSKNDFPEMVKTYVMQEHLFTDFSDDEWRKQNVKPTETSCTNVDPNLIDAWANSKIGTSNGNWLKRWFKSQGGENEVGSAQPNRTVSRLLPTVFGAHGAGNDKEQKTEANASVPVPQPQRVAAVVAPPANLATAVALARASGNY